MNFFKKIFSTLLVVVITITVGAYVISAILLNPHYWQTKASSYQLYKSISKSLPATLAPGNTPDAIMAQQALAGLASDQYLKNKIDPFLSQLLSYYQGSAPAPQLDFTDLITEAERQGVAVPTSNPLANAIVPTAPAGIKSGFSWVGRIKIMGPVVALVLFSLLMLVTRGRHRFTSMAKVCFAAALSEGVLYLLLKIAPGMLDSLIKSKANAGPLAETLVGFFKSALADVGNGFGQAAVALLAAGVITIVAGLIFRAMGFVGRHTGDEKANDRYTRPNPDNRPNLN